ncbi:hypothetical protein StoSoilB5_23370 [Arthrobacter sp. StoSoilB5]|nr:hypothetical protein StoSoilB5_23370 [Arthrobacter sp. StoSoilB5]
MDIVHTSFLLDRQPKDGESALQALQMTCWLAALNPSEASGQDQAPTSKARLPPAIMTAQSATALCP